MTAPRNQKIEALESKDRIFGPLGQGVAWHGVVFEYTLLPLMGGILTCLGI